jgi:hypothetical protein
MGAGDWLMATGQVREMYERNPVPVMVVGADKRPQWHEVFANNPKIADRRRRGPYQVLRNGPGARPYIEASSGGRWLWREFGPPRGELCFSLDERMFAKRNAGRIMIEPNVKKNGHANKAWPFERWQQLVDRMPHRFLQCGPIGTRWLRGVDRVVTQTFRHACAALSTSRAFVGTEGGLMHAAAAVGVPAVVLWSEFIAPSVTGYEAHRNIRHAGEPCGMRSPCKGCEASMLAISVDEVEQNLSEVVS